MMFPNREAVERVRREFPVGCRIVLDSMADPYVNIPEGTQAAVLGVDDAGSVMPAWDCGSTLNIVFGEDCCHKIAAEEEAKITLDWYGSHQPEEHARCPRCGDMMWGPKRRHALSRRAKITVCDSCGVHESLEDAGLEPRKPLMEWCACVIPQVGGGKWKR